MISILPCASASSQGMDSKMNYPFQPFIALSFRPAHCFHGILRHQFSCLDAPFPHRFVWLDTNGHSFQSVQRSRRMTGLHVSFVRAAFLFVACSCHAQLPRSCPTTTRMDAFRCTLDLMARRGTKSVVIQIEAKRTVRMIQIEPTAARNGGGGSFAQEGSGEPAVGSNQIIYVRITTAIQIIVNQWSVHPRWGLRHLRIQTFERLRGGSRGLVGRMDRTVEGRARPITEVHPARRLNTRTQRGAWEGDGGSRCNTCIYNGWIGGADD